MSVAFRRDSDEDHKEPAFDIPIAPGPNLVTPRGLALIEARVVELETAVAAADEVSRATLQRDLRYWHTRRATAEVVPAPGANEIGIGSRVTVRMNGGVRRLAIVGGDEADPARGLIGFQAPLARALIGATAGDWIDFAGTTAAVEVVAID